MARMPGLSLLYMGYVRIGLVAVNALAFLTLLVMAIRFMQRESSRRVKSLWMLVALASGALVIGAIQRVVLQAAVLGWIPGTGTVDVVEDWQIVQSLVVVALVVASFFTVKRLADSMAATERIAGSILDRVTHVDLEDLDLTVREKEVLAAIGTGLLTDAELAEELHISVNTVQTHVKRLLRKSGLNRRQDLIAVAYLVESNGP